MLILSIIYTDTKCNQYSLCVYSFFSLLVFLLLLCKIPQIATGVPYSESPRKKPQIALILITIGRNLTCSRPVQSFDLLLKQERWGSHVLRVLSKIAKKRGGRMSLGCSQKKNCAPSPRTCFN
jgi:hypothetical protein